MAYLSKMLGLLPPRGQRVLLTGQRLRLPNRQSSTGLVSPKALDVVEHLDNLFVAELVPKCRHTALEARIARVFQKLPALADDSIQETV